MAHRREPSLDFDSLLSSWDAGAMPDVVDEACGSPVRRVRRCPLCPSSTAARQERPGKRPRASQLSQRCEWRP